MRNITFVLTFFCLWLATQLNSVAQDVVAYVLILTFGVLHGANDLQLLNKAKAGKGLNTNMLVYFLVVVGVFAVFMFSGSLALLTFVAISGYHFGEQHFNKYYKGPSIIGSLLYLCYGLSILFMIFYLKLNNVIAIIEDLTNYGLTENFMFMGLLTTLTAFLMLFSWSILNKHLSVNWIKELFLLAVFYVVFSIASLSWSFAIYFVFWHSLPSIKDQLLFLYGKADKHSFKKYLKSSWPYWLVSMLGLFGLYFLLKNEVNYLLTILLYVLAAITFPHVVVMSKLEVTKT